MDEGMLSRRTFVLSSAAMIAVSAMGFYGCKGGGKKGGKESDGEMMDESYMVLEEREDGSRVMNDVLGEIEVPKELFRIACTAPAQTSGLLLLGAVDKIVAIDSSFAKSTWALSKYPQMKKLPVVFSNNETNVEELLNQKPDLVLYASRYGDKTRLQLEELGIICSEGMKQSDDDGIDYLDRVRDNAAYRGLLIGGPQATAAKNFRQEFAAIRKKVQARTQDLGADKRPTVCEISSAGQQLQVNNGSAIGQMLIDLAGGINAAKNAAGESAGPSGQTIIEPETLLNYNPDILIIDKPGYLDELKNDPILKQLKAIETGRTYIAPTGMMSWPYNGPEEYLNMYFFAKCIQPELFADIDMEAESRAFYKTYFGFDLDDSDLQMIFNLQDGQKVKDIFDK